MHRRLAIVSLAASPVVVLGQQTPDSRTLLTRLVQAIRAAAEALSRLATSFERASVDATISYSAPAAQRELSGLRALSRQTTGLIASNAATIETLEEYMESYNVGTATQSRWRNAIRRLESTLSAVKALISDVRRENSDFVLEPAFLTLSEALEQRSALLQSISGMPAPASREEILLLQEATGRYRELVANTRRSLTALNTYIRNRAMPTSGASSPRA
jgi:hypothetical protein